MGDTPDVCALRVATKPSRQACFARNAIIALSMAPDYSALAAHSPA